MEQTATEWAEWTIRHVFFWEPDDAKKGRIVRAIHHAVMFGLSTMILVSHTVYPAFWLQTLVLGFCFLIWGQHVLTNGCVLSKVEQKWIGDEASFVDPFLDLFHVEANEASKRGIVILGSTVVVSLLSLEWVSRVFHKIIPFVKGQLLTSLSTLHILPTSSSP
jgi:hypothetical protein